MASSSPLRPATGCLSRIGSQLASSALPRSPLRASFSTTAQQCKRKTKDSNKKRGVSSLYGSGPREHLSMSDIPLPKPRDFKPKIPVDKSHGLWGFFPEPGKAIWTPKETEEHGRAWTVEELRKKSWEDLHALWWVCCKERNMLSTSMVVLVKDKLGFGDSELEARDQEVRKTMRAIKHALTERYYTWQDAVDVAMTDPEIDMHAENGKIYQSKAYEEEIGIQESMSKESATEESVAEKGVTGENVTEGSVDEKSMDEKSVTEKVVAEKDVTEGNVTEKSVTEESVTDKVVTEKSVTEESVAEKDVTEGNVTEKSVTEESMTEESVAEKDVTEGNVTEKSVTEKSVTEKSMEAAEKAETVRTGKEPSR
ncbi:hypothetical protein E4U55_007234 [Claviceps digitariae]|nr:hypothetical protein E4U55_007234 [Claviceps digitariae]